MNELKNKQISPDESIMRLTRLHVAFEMRYLFFG
jgi:hypothetical protein